MKKISLLVLSASIVIPSLANTSVVFAKEAPSNTIVKTTEEQTYESKTEEMIGNVKIKKEQAIEIAKSFLPVSEDFVQDSISLDANSYLGKHSVWNVRWRLDVEKKDFYGNYNVSVDAETGEVLAAHLYKNDQHQETVFPPKVDWEKSREIADQYLKEHFQEKLENVKYDSFYEKNQRSPLQGDVTYHIRYPRIINNIPFDDNFINIGVNSNGEITSFEYRWNNDLEFPTQEGMIPSEKAKTDIITSYPLQLSYQKLYDYHQFVLPKNNDKQTKVVLSYTTVGNYHYFDAIQGKWLDYSGDIADMINTGVLVPLSDTLLSNPNQPKDGELTKDEAIAIINQYFAVPENAVLSDVNYYNQKENEASWRFTWQGKEEHLWMSASINAQNGEILHFSIDKPWTREQQQEETNVKVSYEDAKVKALKEVMILVPGKAHELTFDPNMNMKQPEKDVREYHFTFKRIVNSILVPEDSISIGISAESGETIRFYQNWDSKSEYMKPDKIVDVEIAKEEYFNNYHIEPAYVVFRNYDYAPMGTRSLEEKLLLVYRLRTIPSEEPVYLDALTGKWTSKKTGEMIKEQPKPTDVQGHWAEDQLRLMIEYKVVEVDDNGKVFPNQSITRGEMIKMIMLTTNSRPYFEKMRYELAEQKTESFNDVSYSSPYYAYIESAVRQGLIETDGKEFKPDELVSREELAVLIVKALNFDKLADVESLFNLDFKDNDKIVEKGDVAIVQHLKIMSGSNGYFKPSSHVTRAQAAKTYFEYLINREKLK